MKTYDIDQVLGIANDWQILRHHRLEKLEAMTCEPLSFPETVRAAHIEDLLPTCQLVEAILNGENYKYIVTVTAKPSTTAKSFQTHLCKYLDKFFKLLCRRQWQALREAISGYVSIERFDRKRKSKPIHAHIVFNIPQEIGKMLVTEVRSIAKRAAEYPKSRLRVLHPRRTHACTIRRRQGDSLYDAQRRTADYFVKTLKYDRDYRGHDYGPGVYRLALHRAYKLVKFA
jgi:hypothetical protein